MKYNWYDKEKKECVVCSWLLQDNPILLKDHEKTTFHKWQVATKGVRNDH